MGAEEHVRFYGLFVRDAEGYASYRRHMSPILARYGGRFSCDFVVSEVLRSPGDAPINRVFGMVFPSAESAERFFADTAYLEVRKRLFEPSVSAVTSLGRYLSNEADFRSD